MTLVLMACSATKKPHTRPVPAIELYDGPLWQTLRLGKPAGAHVCVLSGKYGFINALARISTYEARLTPEKADRLIARGIMAPNDHHGAIRPGRMPGTHAFVEAGATGRARVRPYLRVIVAGSRDYARVFDAFIEQFIEHELVAGGALIQRTHGGIGEQRRQLGQWLIAARGRGTDERLETRPA